MSSSQIRRWRALPRAPWALMVAATAVVSANTLSGLNTNSTCQSHPRLEASSNVRRVEGVTVVEQPAEVAGRLTQAWPHGSSEEPRIFWRGTALGARVRHDSD